jgi:hypothetical protein
LTFCQPFVGVFAVVDVAIVVVLTLNFDFHFKDTKNHFQSTLNSEANKNFVNFLKNPKLAIQLDFP